MKNKILTVLKDPMSDELKYRFIVHVFNDEIIKKLDEINEKGQRSGFKEVRSLYIEL